MLKEPSPAGRHVARPTVTKIPMLVINKLEVWQGELFLNQFCQFVLDGFGPMTNKDNELINGPRYTAARYLCIVALELRLIMLGLSTEILLGPDLTVQVWIVYKGFPFLMLRGDRPVSSRRSS